MQQRRDLAGHESRKREAQGRTEAWIPGSPLETVATLSLCADVLGLLGRKSPARQPIFTLSRFALVAPVVIILKE